MKNLSVLSLFTMAVTAMAQDKTDPAQSYIQNLLYEGEKAHLYDWYGVEDIEYVKACEPETYALINAYPHAEVKAALAACRCWKEAAMAFLSAWRERELQKKRGVFERVWHVASVLNGIMCDDARALAASACWYPGKVAACFGVVPDAGYCYYRLPAGAPVSVQSIMAPMYQKTLTKHECADITDAAVKEWQRISARESAAFKREMLHDAEVIRLFDEAEAAWYAYYQQMRYANTCHCKCTYGAEYNRMWLQMLSHRSRWLQVLRDIATPHE